MSTIPKQNLVIDDTIDIGLTADLINGTYKTSSLTDLSNNVYSKISDLSSNVYTALGTKQANLTSTTNLLGIGTSISELNYNNISLNKPDLSVYALNNNLNASNITSGTLSISRGGIGTATLTANQILIGNAATSILQSANLSWNNTSNTLSATNFIGSGSGITNLDYGNISTNKPNLAIYQPLITVSTPLVKDVSNNITIDLSAYPLKTYVDGSLNTINTTLSNKQNNLTFSNPFLNTSVVMCTDVPELLVDRARLLDKLSPSRQAAQHPTQ